MHRLQLRFRRAAPGRRIAPPSRRGADAPLPAHFGFELLTANPPYVMVAEKADMRQNVLGWEPHMAIFAPEEDPLVFHKAIADVAMRVLVSGGCGIVEINSEIPDRTAAVFTAAGFEDIRIIPDYFDRPRFISFRRP